MTGKGKERAMTKDTKKAGINPPRFLHIDYRKITNLALPILRI